MAFDDHRYGARESAVVGLKQTYAPMVDVSHEPRWGRIAVYVAMVAPVFYALTRYAWALGIPLGMSQEHLRRGFDGFG